MKKVIKIGSLLLGILLLIVIFNNNIINSISWTTHTFSTGAMYKNGATTYNQDINDFTDVTSVYVDMNSASSIYTATLFQTNVFCVEHGVQIDSDSTDGYISYNGWYAVGSEKTVTDPGLSWILYQRYI